MTINGTNITAFNARQHHVEFGYSDISNASEWLQSAVLPHFSTNIHSWKKFSVDLFVYGSSRDQIHNRVSAIYAQLMKPATLVLDGFSHTFKAIMTGHSEDEFVRRKKHKIKISFEGYEYGSQVTATGNGSVGITNPGTAESPLMLVITPTATATNVRLTGVCRNKKTDADLPVILASMTNNVAITLDGANGLFTEGSTLKSDITIKAMPSVKPGVTQIASSNSNVNLQATVLPIYL